jgi:hypothetical protein
VPPSIAFPRPRSNDKCFPRLFNIDKGLLLDFCFLIPKLHAHTLHEYKTGFSLSPRKHHSRRYTPASATTLAGTLSPPLQQHNNNTDNTTSNTTTNNNTEDGSLAPPSRHLPRPLRRRFAAVRGGAVQGKRFVPFTVFSHMSRPARLLPACISPLYRRARRRVARVPASPHPTGRTPDFFCFVF